jgi:hypothetical protein
MHSRSPTLLIIYVFTLLRSRLCSTLLVPHAPSFS